jgi:hypothetical protein
MKTWIHRHGQLLSRVSLVAVLLALAAPIVAIFFSIPYLTLEVPYPEVNPINVALTVGGVLAVVGLAAGLAVWILHAPGYHLGMAAVLVLGAMIVSVGGIMVTGLLMSASHIQMRS